MRALGERPGTIGKGRRGHRKGHKRMIGEAWEEHRRRSGDYKGSIGGAWEKDRMSTGKGVYDMDGLRRRTWDHRPRHPNT